MSRDITFDLMKGLVIIAMLCGHCVIPDAISYYFILLME